MIAIIKNNKIKNNSFSYLSVILSLVLSFNLFTVTSLEAQAKKYARVDKIKRDTYNFFELEENNQKRQKKDRNFYQVFSDQSKNNVYLDPYAQKKGKEQDFLKPYYVIDQENDFLEIVAADPKIIGKPKGLFSFLSRGKYTFKDAKQVDYIGWIHKNNVIHYPRAQLSDYNYKSVRYLLAIHDLKTLFNIKKHLKKDSVVLYKDPKLSIKSKQKLLTNQVVYFYKYNENKTAALISNKEVIQPIDSTSQMIGWVPKELIKPIGQQQVYKINAVDTLNFIDQDTLIHRREIRGDYIFNLSKQQKINTRKSDTIEVGIPLDVWNHYDNKLINVDGDDVLIRKIDEIKKEQKIMNFHFVFDCSEDLKKNQLRLMASLQRVWLLLSDPERYHGYEFSFSASSFGCGKFYSFPKSTSFFSWVDYLQKVFSNDPSVQTNVRNTEGITQCLEYALEGMPKESFSNTIILVSGAKKFYTSTYTKEVTKRLGKTSSRLLFYQLESRATDEYQEYILQSKEILSQVSRAHAKFIRAFIVDNKLLKPNNTFTYIPSEDNIYIYDAPQNSTYQGGVVFPKINKDLIATSFDTALDSVLTKTEFFNATLVNSLEYYADELGFLRSKASNKIKKIVEKDSIYTNRLFEIPKNNSKEIYYKNKELVLKENPGVVQGYLLDKEELENVIDNYKALVPLFTKEVKRKERRIVYRMYKKYIRGINKEAYKRTLRRKSDIASLVFQKTGLPVQDEFFRATKIKHIKRKRRISHEEFSGILTRLRKKIETLEKVLVTKNAAIFLDGSKKKFYFVSTQDIL